MKNNATIAGLALAFTIAASGTANAQSWFSEADLNANNPPPPARSVNKYGVYQTQSQQQPTQQELDDAYAQGRAQHRASTIGRNDTSFLTGPCDAAQNGSLEQKGTNAVYGQIDKVIPRNLQEIFGVSQGDASGARMNECVFSEMDPVQAARARGIVDANHAQRANDRAQSAIGNAIVKVLDNAFK